MNNISPEGERPRTTLLDRYKEILGLSGIASKDEVDKLIGIGSKGSIRVRYTPRRRGEQEEQLMITVVEAYEFVPEGPTLTLCLSENQGLKSIALHDWEFSFGKHGFDRGRVKVRELTIDGAHLSEEERQQLAIQFGPIADWLERIIKKDKVTFPFSILPHNKQP